MDITTMLLQKLETEEIMQFCDCCILKCV